VDRPPYAARMATPDLKARLGTMLDADEAAELVVRLEDGGEGACTAELPLQGYGGHRGNRAAREESPRWRGGRRKPKVFVHKDLCCGFLK